jgi:hypothetical protein
MATIKIRRGTQAELASATVAEGELCVTTDTDRIYLAGAGNTVTQLKGLSTFTLPHAFAISGDINVASGDTDFINSFFVNLITGQTARIIGYKCKVNSGSCVIDVKQNGTVVINDVSVTTTASSNLLQDIDLATGDEITIEVVSTSSAKNLSLSIFVEYVCS